MSSAFYNLKSCTPRGYPASPLGSVFGLASNMEVILHILHMENMEVILQIESKYLGLPRKPELTWQTWFL